MEQKQKLEQFKGQSRLPKFAVPKHYDLTLKIDLSVCTFLGTVLIKLTVVEPTKFLVLNALELVISGVWFSSSSCDDQQYRPSDVVLDSDDEILVLVFDEALDVGEGVLGIEFSGILHEHMKGLYRGTYVDEGVKKNMAVTQFEAVDARRCFPCWDEPALKATFKIAVNVPSELTALSNMPVTKEELNGHLKTLYFEESPIMSTYLVAIVVGLFDHVEEETADGILVRVYCPVGKSEKGKFALDVAVKVLDLYAKYFTVPYPLPKLDMVAIPDFAAGAMENYGLITYRECELLYDELHSTAANKQRLVVVVSHEVAHQWFGNLVTMEWWTHLWLNEGFATWISYLAADSLFPEWKIWTQFLEEINNGLHIDALEQSHPIEVEVHHARSIDEIFDSISYKKGCSIIRMLQDYIGDHVFQKSLGLYVKRYACKNARTEDLWGVLSEESGIEVKALMDKWTKQKGYPVLFVKSEDNILEFEQSQFLLSGLHSDGQWLVPVTLSVGSYDRHKKFLLKTKSGRINISELFYSPDGNSSSFQKKSLEIYDKPSWVKVNVEQTGFYRVKYDDKLTALLRKAIENNWLSAADKYGVLDDTYALCQACELPLSSLLTLMEVYKKETDYIVLSRLIEICCFVSKISIDAIPDLVHELNQFLVHLLLFSAEQLGWESVSGHSHLSTMLREQVLMALAGFGHDETVREGLKRFQIFLEDRNTPVLPADTRKAAYLSVMRNVTTANRNGFESLLKLYREADGVQEKTRVLRYFLSCPDQNIVLEGLNLLLSNEIRGQDVIYVLRGIIPEGRETAWTWLKENWESILNKWGSGLLLTDIVKDIVLPFCSNERADEVEAFFESCANPSIGMTVKQSVEQVRIKAKWVQNIKHEQSLPELVKELASR